MYTKNQDDDDIEFAGRLLNHREETDDREARRWLEEREHVCLLDELAGIKEQCDQRTHASSKAEVYRRLKRSIRKKKMIRRWMTTAACVFVLLGSVCMYRLIKPETLQPIDRVAQTQIRPGSVKAELILTDGSGIGLNKENKRIEIDGIGNIRNDSLQGLDYTSVRSADDGEHPSYHILKVPAGGFYRLTLADSTKVWLNAASELKYPVRFGTSGRHVYLRGEAYFEVVHRGSQPFIVHALSSRVTVTGTKFNVNAYEEEKKVYATLAEGSVRFYSEKSGQNIRMRPGLQSVMNLETGKTEVREVDTHVYTGWVDGHFIFRELDLETILRQLQRWYDFQVFYQHPEVKRYKFQGMIDRDMNIQDVLKIMEETTGVTFRVDGKTIVVMKE